EDEAQADLLAVIERPGVVCIDVISPVASRILERAIDIGAVVSDIGVSVPHHRTPREKRAPVVEISALQARHVLVGQRLTLAAMPNAKTAEIAIFRTEGAVGDGNFLDEFRA